MNTSSNQDWQIFICYRQVDGAEIAKWIYNNISDLKIHESRAPDGVSRRIKTYLDTATPAVGNWKSLNNSSLAASRALIVVCTPGLFSRLGDDDWAYREIEWWLKNRTAAPILIDVTGEAYRWVPKPIKEKWPNAQLVRLNSESLKNKKSEGEAKALFAERIVGGVTASHIQMMSEEQRIQKESLRRLKSYLRVSILLTVLLIISVGITIKLQRETSNREQELNHTVALKLLSEAESAIKRGDIRAGKVHAANALKQFESEDIKLRVSSLQKWMNGSRIAGLHYFEKLLSSETIKLINQHNTVFGPQRDAEVSSIRLILDSWIKLSADEKQIDARKSYNIVINHKNIGNRIEAVHRQLLRLSDRDSQQNQERLILAEAEISRLIYQGPDDITTQHNWLNLLESEADHLSSLRRELFDESLRTKINSSSWLNIDWMNIQKVLRTDEILVDFFRYDNAYCAWILRKDTNPVRVEFGDADSLEMACSRFTDAVFYGRSNPESNTSPSRSNRNVQAIRPILPDRQSGIQFNDAGITLKNLLWKPIAKHLRLGTNTIYVIPDGIIATLPLSAIPLDDSGSRSVIDDYLVSNLLHATDIIGLGKKRDLGKGVILMGGIDYDKNLRKTPDSNSGPQDTIKTNLIFRQGAEHRKRNFHPLPGTLKEVQALQKLFNDFSPETPITLLTGADATEDTLRKSSKGHRYVHLATHGWATDRLGFSPDFEAAKSYAVDAFIISLDPALMAGMAFAGANYGGNSGFNDGILTSLEKSGFELGSAELVVLSGCETASTPIGGQSFLGLVSGVKNAGAENVVASLYSVDDYITVRLMEAFYRLMLQHRLVPALALREASLSLKNSGFGPFYWAAFVTYGPVR